MPVLAALRHAGWQQVILTNHVPEFRAIAEALGIASAVDAIVNSAETGAEKPHEAAFQFARSALGIAHDAAYVVGDSYAADITGAERAGLPGILVRTDDDRAHHRASDLYAAVRLLERLSDARY